MKQEITLYPHGKRGSLYYDRPAILTHGAAMRDAEAFVRTWENGWNSHDLDAIMRPYREDIVFRSKEAIPLTGQGELQGRAALRAYWIAALKRQLDLRFAVRDVFEGHDMLTITYLIHRGVLAAETLYINEGGRVFQAAACHRTAMA